MLGNCELPHRAATRSFAEGVAWLAQIGLFVMLGLLLSPGPDRRSRTVGLALVAGLVLTVRRAAAVGGRQLGGPADALAGAVVPVAGPGCAARCRSCSTTIPLAEGVRRRAAALRHRLRDGGDLHAAHRADAAAGRRGCSRWPRRSEPRDLEVEAAPLERIAADLLQVTITPESRMHGVEVGELRLPPGRLGVAGRSATGETLVPERRTVLRHGDELLVVTPAQAARGDRAAAARRSARAAGWPSGWPDDARPAERQRPPGGRRSA